MRVEALKQLERFSPTLEAQEKVEELWNKVKDQAYAFDDLIRGNPIPFLAELVRPGNEHFLHPHGMVSLRDIQPKINASIHFLTWDRTIPVRDAVEIGKFCMHYAFQTFDLHRISTTIPSGNKGAAKLAVLLGMKFEGTMRETFLYNGRYEDVFLYGILKHEFEARQEVKSNGRLN